MSSSFLAEKDKGQNADNQKVLKEGPQKQGNQMNKRQHGQGQLEQSGQGHPGYSGHSQLGQSGQPVLVNFIFRFFSFYLFIYQ